MPNYTQRQMLLDKEQKQQDYAYDLGQFRNQRWDLNTSIQNNALGSNNARASWWQDTSKRENTRLSATVTKYKNDYNNWLRGWNMQYAQAASNGTPRPKTPADPTPPTAPVQLHASVDPVTGQVVYPDEVYNGYDPTLAAPRDQTQPYYDPAQGKMIYPGSAYNQR